jgi:hypothetical protein
MISKTAILPKKSLMQRDDLFIPDLLMPMPIFTGMVWAEYREPCRHESWEVVAKGTGIRRPAKGRMDHRKRLGPERLDGEGISGKAKLDDSLFPDRPVVMTRIDGHAAIANQRALDAAGIRRTAMTGEQ